ncbi:hypothetical protein HN51_022554 [Arachis hypogaea]|nr:uncharacterized protein DS421_2g51480 [Arachis hypogaea]
MIFKIFHFPHVLFNLHIIEHLQRKDFGLVKIIKMILFIAAYKECTKNDNNHHQRSGDGGERKKKKKNKKLVNKGSGLMIESRLRKGLSFFSCKKFSSVHDNNNLVTISSFPNNNNNIIDRD